MGLTVYEGCMYELVYVIAVYEGGRERQKTSSKTRGRQTPNTSRKGFKTRAKRRL